MQCGASERSCSSTKPSPSTNPRGERPGPSDAASQTNGLTEAAALDHAPDGIRINAIAAGSVNTPLIADRPPDVLAARVALHPLARLAQPSEIADAAVWLCSDKSSFVTGAAIPVDGGWTAQ
jgi:NAD(P)-dependent dehydrogenase (short-subunit alcohol dehydrogenase family)